MVHIQYNILNFCPIRTSKQLSVRANQCLYKNKFLNCYEQRRDKNKCIEKLKEREKQTNNE